MLSEKYLEATCVDRLYDYRDSFLCFEGLPVAVCQNVSIEFICEVDLTISTQTP